MDKKAVNSDTKTSSSTSSPSASVEDEVQLEAMSAIKELEERDNSSKEKIIKFVPFVSLIFIETFTLNFFAEWGDKSQLATILLAAKDNVFGVASGAIFGQAICITLAVIGGQLMSKLVSIKTGELFNHCICLVPFEQTTKDKMSAGQSFLFPGIRFSSFLAPLHSPLCVFFSLSASLCSI